jgi:hypothetical protein
MWHPEIRKQCQLFVLRMSYSFPNATYSHMVSMSVQLEVLVSGTRYLFVTLLLVACRGTSSIVALLSRPILIV